MVLNQDSQDVRIFRMVNRPVAARVDLTPSCQSLNPQNPGPKLVLNQDSQDVRIFRMVNRPVVAGVNLTSS
jgi:hypothetical protein